VYERLTKLEQNQEQTNVKLDGISLDVKSLLESRSFTRGVLRTATAVSTVVSVIIGLVVAYLRGH
jgi:hypothetical protein